MSAAMIEAHVEVQDDGGAGVGVRVWYGILAGKPAVYSVSVPFAAADTPATFGAKVLAAIDAGAQALGLAAPTKVYSLTTIIALR